jgi:hypothetical protein
MHSFEEQTKNRIYERNKFGINSYFGGQNILDNNQTENKLIFLFKKTINYFEENIQDPNLKNQLINNVQKTLDLIHSKKIDVSKIDIGALDEEINQYFINEDKNNNNNKDTNKFNNEIDEGKLQKFFKSKYKYIYNGDTIEKLNYNNKNLKEHFYQIDKGKDYFQAFKSNNKNPDKNYEFYNIIQICYGVKTENINSKLKTLKSKGKNIPYLLISLILKKRTIDLIFNDEKSARSWFYGLYYHLKTTNRIYKIGSFTGYILFRIKCKLIKNLGKKYSNIDKLHLSSLLNQYL